MLSRAKRDNFHFKVVEMIAVIFEVFPTSNGKQEYLEIAGELKQHLSLIEGFISIERFQSLVDPNKILSLSFWENEEAVTNWRNLEAHRIAQSKGRKELFEDYRIRVGNIVRDYSLEQRKQVPGDSQHVHSE
jgi:heme-degrading monooxygenase HmoA